MSNRVAGCTRIVELWDTHCTCCCCRCCTSILYLTQTVGDMVVCTRCHQIIYLCRRAAEDASLCHLHGQRLCEIVLLKRLIWYNIESVDRILCGNKLILCFSMHRELAAAVAVAHVSHNTRRWCHRCSQQPSLDVCLCSGKTWLCALAAMVKQCAHAADANKSFRNSI